MADENTLTEEQAKASNEAEMAKWEGDFKEEDLIVPYKREEDDKGKKTDIATDDKQDSHSEEDEKVEPDEAYVEPTPVVTIQDPGEFKPADYSFSVTDKDGKSITIKTPEEADAFADDEDNFKTAKDFKNFLINSQKMQSKLDRDMEKWQADKDAFNTQKEAEAARTETVNTMAAEFDYLTARKLLPPIAKEYKDADWTDPEVAKQSGVKEQLDLLNYMAKENEVRQKAGVKPITSIVDAFNAWTLDQSRQTKDNEDKAAGEQRKAAGARVAGVSPTQTGAYVPKGIAVGNPNVLKRSVAQWDN